MRFEHVSEAENNLFIDQVVTTPATAVRQVPTAPLMAKLSPNPTQYQTQLSLYWEQPAVFIIRVYNALGQMILEKAESGQGSMVYQLHTQTWAAGCYTVQVQGANRTWTGRLMVQ